MVEYLTYMIKVKETGSEKNLKNFCFQNFSLKKFSVEEKKILEKNFLELKGEEKKIFSLDDIDKVIDQGRQRASLSVNLKAGYKFRFLRNLTTEVKVTDGIISANRNNNVLANFSEYITDNTLIKPKKIELNNSKIFNQCEKIADKKVKFLLKEKTPCRICEEKLSRMEFIRHVKYCYKKKKKVLKIAEISDQILLRAKKFERMRRCFKLDILNKHALGDMKIKRKEKRSLKKMKTFAYLGSMNVASISKKNNDEDELREKKKDYRLLLKFSKNLKSFCNELKMEPLFTKSDLLVRRDISKTLESLTGKYTASINITLKELSYCLDQRLAEIEKYLNIEKEQNGDISSPTRSRRGATMSGIMEFGIEDFKEKIDKRATKDTFSSSSFKENLFGDSGRSTFDKKLGMFRVTNSDKEEEDKDFFDESDHELEIEKMLRESRKKTEKKENIFRRSLGKRKSQNVGGRAAAGSFSTLSLFERKDEKKSEEKEKEDFNRKTDFSLKISKTKDDNIEEKKNKSNEKMRKTSIEFNLKNSEDKKNLEEKKDNNKVLLKKVKEEELTPTTSSKFKEDQILESQRKESTNRNYTKQIGLENLNSMDVDLPVSISIQEINYKNSFSDIEEKSHSKKSRNSSEERRKPTCLNFENSDSEDQEYELRRSSPVQINFEDEIEDEEIFLESNLRMTEPLYLEDKDQKKKKKDDLDHRSRVFNIFDDFDEIDTLVKELKKKEETMLKTKKTGQKLTRKKSMRVSSLWKKVLTTFAKQEHITPTLKKQDTKEQEELEENKICAEDIERLTASDPAEYFKSNTTLLSKMSIVTIDEFEYVHTLGAGAYGKVFLVRKKASGDFFAMKVIGSDKELSSKYVKNLLNEREVFSVIKSNFCVNALATFTYENLVCFVMEYLPGRDLHEELFERETYWLDSFSVKFYLAEIILGIEDLHQNGVIHRDIKPANVLIDEEGHLKLTDFGLSEFRSKIGSQVEDKGNYIKGSANYIAPEVIRGEEVSFEVDWWALGVMAYLMVAREFPFDGESIQEVFDSVIKGEIDWSNVGEEDWQITPLLQDLIKKLLNPDPKKRLGHASIQEIKDHPYFKGIYWEPAKQRKLPLFEPEDMLDLTQFEKKGISMKKYLDKEFSHLLNSKLKKTNAKLPFANRFELLRMEPLHWTNIKKRKEIKEAALEFMKEERQTINVIQDFCLQEGLYFYRNFSDL